MGVRGRLATDDPSTAVAACVAGQGVFQSLEMGLGSWLKSGELVQILSEWSEERYPLYAYYPSRHLPPAKVGLLAGPVDLGAGGRTVCTGGCWCIACRGGCCCLIAGGAGGRMVCTGGC